jgi:hypothetical protein
MFRETGYKPKPRVLHYESYAGMLAAVEHCELCALVVEGWESSPYWHSGLAEPVYRTLAWEPDYFPLPQQKRRLERIDFVGREVDIPCARVELYVEEGKVVRMGFDALFPGGEPFAYRGIICIRYEACDTSGHCRAAHQTCGRSRIAFEMVPRW